MNIEWHVFDSMLKLAETVMKSLLKIEVDSTMRCRSRSETDSTKLQDEKRKKKEEEERKRKEERAKKFAEFEKFKNPAGPNFVISRRGGGGGGGGEVRCDFSKYHHLFSLLFFLSCHREIVAIY